MVSTSVIHVIHGLLLIYRPQRDGRLSWVNYLENGGRFAAVSTQLVDDAVNVVVVFGGDVVDTFAEDDEASITYAMQSVLVELQ